MKISFKKRLLSLLTAVTLTIPLIPVIPTYAWTPSFSNRDPNAYGNGMTGNYPKTIPGATELDRITFVNSVTGENAFPPFFVSSEDIKSHVNIDTIEWAGNGKYGKSKLDYITEQSYDPMWGISYFYIKDFPTFLNAGTINQDKIRKILSDDKVVNDLVYELKNIGINNAENVLHNQSAYKILIEPCIIAKMTNGDVIAMSSAEMALRNMASGGDWYTYIPTSSFWASNGPDFMNTVGASAQVDKPHTFTRGGGITINPYSDDQDANGIGGMVPRPKKGGGYVWIYNNVTMLNMMGIAILSPDTMPPNYQATELEAEYLPASNEVKVRALSSLDPKNSWKYDGLNNEIQSWSEYQSLTKDGLVKVSDKPAYTPGFTKSMVYLTWGSDYDKKTGKGAVYEDGRPLYIENMKAYPIPKDENYLNINTTLDKYTI